MTSIIASIGIALFSIGCAFHALLHKRDSKSALAWVAICLFLPLIGAFTYLIFGINRTGIKAQRFYRETATLEDPHSNNEQIDVKIFPLAKVGENVCGRKLQSFDEVRMLENGEELFPSMLNDIAKAKNRIYISTYIFQNDRTGKQFLLALHAAKERHVKVNIIIDGLGALIYPPRIARSLKSLGLEFREFNAISLLPPSVQMNMRNHRKIMVIDGKIGYTGGQNISDRHLVEMESNPKKARDLHFRFSGSIVHDLELAFLRDWNFCGSNSSKTELISREKFSQNNIGARLILDGPNENLDRLNELLVGIFSCAKKRIWIMTPYFLPGFDLLGAMIGARLRGVDIKILLPENPNIPFVRWAVFHNLKFFVNRGFGVYFIPNPFIHTKAILIDDNYSLIGSANLDPRSLRLNFELGMEIFNESLNKKLSSYFEHHLSTAILVDQEKLKSVSTYEKVRNAFAWLFSPYL